MRIKLTVPLSGANGAYGVGDEYPCTQAEAQRLIKAGFAVAVKKKTERASKKAPKKETRG